MPGKRCGETNWSYMTAPALYMSETVNNTSGDLDAVDALTETINMGECERARGNSLAIGAVLEGVTDTLSLEIYVDMGAGLAVGAQRWCLYDTIENIEDSIAELFTNLPATQVKLLVVGLASGGAVHLTFSRTP
jgi:hypothetical protein